MNIALNPVFQTPIPWSVLKIMKQGHLDTLESLVSEFISWVQMTLNQMKHAIFEHTHAQFTQASVCKNDAWWDSSR